MSPESSKPESGARTKAGSEVLSSIKSLMQQTAQELRQADFSFQESFKDLDPETASKFPALSTKEDIIKQINESSDYAEEVDEILESAGPAVKLVVKPFLIDGGTSSEFPAGHNMSITFSKLKPVRLSRAGLKIKGDKILRDTPNSLSITTTGEPVEIGDYVRGEIANATVKFDISGYEFVDSNQTGADSPISDKNVSLAKATSAIHTIQPRFRQTSSESEEIKIEINWKRRPASAKPSEWEKYVDSDEKLQGNISIKDASGIDLPLKNNWNKAVKKFVSEKISQDKLKGAKVKIGVQEVWIRGVSNNGSMTEYNPRKQDVELEINPALRGGGLLSRTPTYKITLYLDSQKEDPKAGSLQIVTHSYNGSGPEDDQSSYKQENLNYSYTLKDKGGNIITIDGVPQKDIARSVSHLVEGIPAGSYVLEVKSDPIVAFASTHRKSASEDSARSIVKNDGDNQVEIPINIGEGAGIIADVYVKKKETPPPPPGKLQIDFLEHSGHGDQKDFSSYGPIERGKLSYVLKDAKNTPVGDPQTIDFGSSATIDVVHGAKTVELTLLTHKVRGHKYHEKEANFPYSDNNTFVSIDASTKQVTLYLERSKELPPVTLTIWTLDSLGIPIEEEYVLGIKDQEELRKVKSKKYTTELPGMVTVGLRYGRKIISIVYNGELYGKVPWISQPANGWNPDDRFNFEVKEDNVVLYITLEDKGGPETDPWPPPRPEQKALPPGTETKGLPPGKERLALPPGKVPLALPEGDELLTLTDGSEKTEKTALEILKEAEETGEDDDATNKWVDKKLWDTFDVYIGNLKKYEDKLLKFLPEESHKDVIDGAKRFFDSRLEILRKFVDRKEKETFGQALEALAECQDVIYFIAKAARESIERRMKTSDGLQKSGAQSKRDSKKLRNILQKADKQLNHMIDAHNNLVERIRKEYPEEASKLAAFEKSIKSELGVSYERIASIFANERPHESKNATEIMNELSIKSRHLGSKIADIGRILPNDYSMDVVKTGTVFSPIKILANAVASASMSVGANVTDIVHRSVEEEKKIFASVPHEPTKQAIIAGLDEVGVKIIDGFNAAKAGNPDYLYERLNRAISYLDKFEKGIRASGVLR